MANTLKKLVEASECHLAPAVQSMLAATAVFLTGAPGRACAAWPAAPEAGTAGQHHWNDVRCTHLQPGESRCIALYMQGRRCLHCML